MTDKIITPMVPFAVTGPRTWENPKPVEKVLTRLAGRYGYARLLMYNGGAAGLDYVARTVAPKMGIHVATIDALWDFHGRAAGPIRNQVMLLTGVSFVVGFHWDWELPRSGTRNCVMQAERLEIKVIRITVSKRVGMPAAFDLMDKQAAKRNGRKSKRKVT
jgi:hypothetical protein